MSKPNQSDREKGGKDCEEKEGKDASHHNRHHNSKREAEVKRDEEKSHDRSKVSDHKPRYNGCPPCPCAHGPAMPEHGAAVPTHGHWQNNAPTQVPGDDKNVGHPEVVRLVPIFLLINFWENWRI